MPKKKPSGRGGKREGAGRPTQGKKPYLVTLTEKNVTTAKAKAGSGKFSALLDDLLADWLGADATPRPADAKK